MNAALFMQVQTTLVVFSWNDNDPTAEDGGGAMYHQSNRGSASVNLLGRLSDAPPEPSNTRFFTFTVKNVRI